MALHKICARARAHTHTYIYIYDIYFTSQLSVFSTI